MTMIEIKHITAGYGKKQILNDLDLCLEKGRLTSIIGANGCGKSTLFKAIIGTVPHTAGEITVDGIRIDTISHKARARRIACLAQINATPDMTVEQLVLCGRYPYLQYPRGYSTRDRAAAQTAMERLNITALAHRRLSSLSGGMRQNVYIAMALAQETDYLLLDEPTTYLDAAHKLSMMQMLRGLADSGIGVAAVMHDLPLALSCADTVAVMDGGQIVLHDTPASLYAADCIPRIFGVRIGAVDGTYYCKLAP